MSFSFKTVANSLYLLSAHCFLSVDSFPYLYRWELNNTRWFLIFLWALKLPQVAYVVHFKWIFHLNIVKKKRSLWLIHCGPHHPQGDSGELDRRYWRCAVNVFQGKAEWCFTRCWGLQLNCFTDSYNSVTDACAGGLVIGKEDTSELPARFVRVFLQRVRTGQGSLYKRSLFCWRSRGREF